jgi:hypothetical protein
VAVAELLMWRHHVSLRENAEGHVEAFCLCGWVAPVSRDARQRRQVHKARTDLFIRFEVICGRH